MTAVTFSESEIIQVTITQTNLKTIDGSEIRRSPLEVGSSSLYLQVFFYMLGGCLGFLNHQQYIFHATSTDQSSSLVHDEEISRHIAKLS